MKQKFFFAIITVLSLPLLHSGHPWLDSLSALKSSLNSEVVIENLTPEELPKNPSDIYTVNIAIAPKSVDIVKDSMKAYIVVDGQTHPMTKSITRANHYSYDFKMPRDANIAKYYVYVDYAVPSFKEKKERSVKSKLYDMHLINRYPSALDVSRGPVGSLITISGRGFTSSDVILFDQKEAETLFESDNIIRFKVPVLPGNKSYEVKLKGNKGLLGIGEFKIDSGNILADHERISLKSHERTTIAFEIENTAPLGGLELDVTTNVPESVIMPEIMIPAGSKRATVVIEGGRPSNGELYVSANGFQELTIPIRISSNEKNHWSK